MLGVKGCAWQVVRLCMYFTQVAKAAVRGFGLFNSFSVCFARFTYARPVFFVFECVFPGGERFPFVCWEFVGAFCICFVRILHIVDHVLGVAAAASHGF